MKIKIKGEDMSQTTITITFDNEKLTNPQCSISNTEKSLNHTSIQNAVDELIHDLNAFNEVKLASGGLPESYDARSEQIDILQYKLTRLLKCMI